MNYLFDKNLFLKEFKKVLLVVTTVKVAIWFLIINYSVKLLNLYAIKKLIDNGNVNMIHTYGIYNIMLELLTYVSLLTYGLLLILRIYFMQKK